MRAQHWALGFQVWIDQLWMMTNYGPWPWSDCCLESESAWSGEFQGTTIRLVEWLLCTGVEIFQHECERWSTEEGEWGLCGVREGQGSVSMCPCVMAFSKGGKGFHKSRSELGTSHFCSCLLGSGIGVWGRMGCLCREQPPCLGGRRLSVTSRREDIWRDSVCSASLWKLKPSGSIKF